MKTKLPNTKLVIAGLPPRHNTMEIRTKVKDYNEEMKKWCDANEMTYINNEELFEFRSGEVDCQSYVMTGKTPAVHITRKATIRMLENIKKSVPNLILSEHPRQMSYAEAVATSKNDWARKQPSSRTWITSTATSPGQRTQPVCWYCGVPGHTKAVCKYQQPLKCHSCGTLGHKKRYCKSNQ